MTPTPEQLEYIEIYVKGIYPMPADACRLTRRGIEGARNAVRKRMIKEIEDSNDTNPT